MQLSNQQRLRLVRVAKQPENDTTGHPKTDPIPKRLVLPDQPKPQPKPVAGVFRGFLFQTELEMRCAAEMFGCGIAWDYRCERLSEARYPIAFRLFELKSWIAVPDPDAYREIDHYRLYDVAAYLKERKERLFVYGDSVYYLVQPERFIPLSEAEFWRALVGREKEKLLDREFRRVRDSLKGT